MTNRVNLENAFVLHTRPFRDTSLLVDVFTQNHGHIMLLAKGVRNQKSPLRSLLLPFTPILVSWVQKGDLPIVNKVEASSLQYCMHGKALLNGMYLNELLIRLLGRHDPNPKLFALYQETLSLLQNKDGHALTIRCFEKHLLIELGYGLVLNEDQNGNKILSDKYYSFEFGTRLKLLGNTQVNQHIFSGKSLLALHREILSDEQEFQDAERLLQISLQRLFGARPIKTLELLK